ncbi:MAG: MarR family transcriptional regulator [Chloroflexota bacterium]
MTDHDALFDEAHRLTRMLVHVGEEAKADFAAAVAPFNIPVGVARAILLLDAPAPMRELAGRLVCDQSYITGIADKLEERGLVMRVPGEDRRIKLLALTSAGTELRDRIAGAVAQQAMVMLRLTDAERAQLGPLLTRLLDSVPPESRGTR